MNLIFHTVIRTPGCSRTSCIRKSENRRIFLLWCLCMVVL